MLVERLRGAANGENIIYTGSADKLTGYPQQVLRLMISVRSISPPRGPSAGAFPCTTNRLLEQ